MFINKHEDNVRCRHTSSIHLVQICNPRNEGGHDQRRVDQIVFIRFMNVEIESIYNAYFNHFPYEFIETEFGLTEILHFTRLGINTNDHDHMCLGLSPTFLLGLLHSKVIKSTHVYTLRDTLAFRRSI